MQTNKPKVLIFSGPEGHLSIAQAIEQGLENTNLHVITHYNEGKNLMKAYKPFYRMFPSLFKVPWQLAQLKTSRKVVEKLITTSKEGHLMQKILRRESPDIVISTWWAANHLLAEYTRDNQISFFNVVTDPRSISAILPSPQAINLTFDKYSNKSCIDLGIEEKNIMQAGWFVRSQFERKYNKSNIRKFLNIPDNELTFLVCGGSDGTNAVIKIIPALLSEKKKIRIYFACGTNRSLYRAVQGFAKVFQTTHSNIHLIPLGFTTKLDKYIKAADLIIGKAGPNLIFESVAALTPFFAITHISGQEDGNLDIIREYNLGIVEENLIKAGRLIQKIIKNPKILENFSPSLEKMRTHNQKSKKILRSAIQTRVHSASSQTQLT